MFEPLNQPIKLLLALFIAGERVIVEPKLWFVAPGIDPVPPFARYVTVYEATVHWAVRVILLAPTVTVDPGLYAFVPSLHPANVKPVRVGIVEETVKVSPIVRLGSEIAVFEAP